MLEKLKGLIVTGDEGDIEVPVIYINPDAEFKAESYPAFVICRSGAYPDVYRYSEDKYYEYTYDSSGNPTSALERNNPEPYNIYYSIRLYYTYQRHGMELNTHIMKTLRRTAYLDIDNDTYDILFVSYKNPNATYREFGKFKEDQPDESIDQYLFRIEMNLEVDSPVQKQLLTQLPIITIHNKP
jgi:hypothetical protein